MNKQNQNITFVAKGGVITLIAIYFTKNVMVLLTRH